MAVKRLEITNIGTVAFYKRRDVRNIRLAVGGDGLIRVTLPKWVPYKVGVEFVRAKQDWITAHTPAQRVLLKSGDPIGKAHRLVFTQMAGGVKTRLAGTEIRVSYPPEVEWQDQAVQLAAERAAIRALKRQGEILLPQRLQELATVHSFSYKSLRIKQLKARWGSCDSQKNITLNLFLLQLPWELVDYVLLHELLHTRVLRHGPPFWEALNEHVPHLSELRKAIRAYQPTLQRVNNNQSANPNNQSSTNDKMTDQSHSGI